MCLAVPMEIIEINGNKAIAESRGVRTPVDTTLAPDIKLGDKVLIHAGFIIEKLDPKAAQEIDEAWDEYLRLQAESEGAAPRGH